MKSEMFEGVYQVHDGYVTGRRPNHFRITSDDLYELEADASDNDILRIYETHAQEAFERDISFATERETEFVAWAREHLRKRESNE